MADFKTHITTSTVLGMGYGAAGHFLLDAPPSTCFIAAGLCGVSGMLPDLDSDSGVPVRETIGFSAAVIPILMIDRFQSFGWTPEMMAAVGGLIYLAVRFGIGAIFKRYTVHRGMWHSLPAAASAGLLAFLICTGQTMELRLFKSMAVVFGFLIHLVLDEIWSIEINRGRIRIKKSFGTAFKLWSHRPWANLSTYAKLATLLALAYSDPYLMQHFGLEERPIPQAARRLVDHAQDQSDSLLR